MWRNVHHEGGAGTLHWAGWLFGALALMALVAVVLHLGDIEHFLALARSLAPTWLVLAVLLQLGTYASVALAWQRGLQRVGHRLPMRRRLPLALAKLFVDQTVPAGGISGTAFLVTALTRQGVPTPACLAALLANLLGHYAAYLLAALVGVAMLAIAHETHAWMAGVFVLFALVSLAIPLGVLALRRYGRVAPPWLLRFPGIASLLEATGQAPLTLVRQPRVVLGMTVLSATVIALDAGTLWVMLHALGIEIPYSAVFPSFLLAMMVATIGPIPLGLGSFEATCVTSLTVQGVPIEGALTATLLLRGCTTWLPMLPGLVLARRELHPATTMRPR